MLATQLCWRSDPLRDDPRALDRGNEQTFISEAEYGTAQIRKVPMAHSGNISHLPLEDVGDLEVDALSVANPEGGALGVGRLVRASWPRLGIVVDTYGPQSELPMTATGDDRRSAIERQA